MRLIYLFCLLPLLGLTQFNKIIEEWKADKSLSNSSLGFCVRDAKTSEVLAEYNSQQSLIPASTLKVFTTATALSQLGSTFRFKTIICHTGTFDKTTGVLNGDLIIKGGGDPTLQSENFPTKLPVTDEWATILKQQGIKEIRGKIVGDASLWERNISGTWLWEDVSNYFGTAPCALSYSDNKFSALYNSKENGSKANLISISPSYKTNSIVVTSEVIAKGTEDQAYFYGDPFSFQKRILGTIPPNKNNYEVEGALPDPALLCAEHLLASLTKAGIKCPKNEVVSVYGNNEGQEKTTILYTHLSPTLDKLIYFTNQHSINLYAECLLYTLGKGDITGGKTAVKKYLQKSGLDSAALFMVDGSGLSRVNAVTTNLISELLCKVFKEPFYQIFNSSLSVSGKDGTMANMGKSSSIANNLRAKTGYMQRARAYCGYVKARSGRDIAFSIIFNNYNCSAREAKLKIEKFLIGLGEL